MAVIEMNNIKKSYYIGEPNELEILHGINLSIEESEFLSIVGQSGSGKSTLMNIIGLLDRQTDGTYFLGGLDISKAKESELSAIRNKRIGFIFQSFNLIPRLTALQNVELPLLYGKLPQKKRRERALELLERVDMFDRKSHVPNELSGGQKQRVAIARAMAMDPDILLADEPPGALDSTAGRLVMDLFHSLHETEKKTIVLITHNDDLAKETDRIVIMKDGYFDD